MNSSPNPQQLIAKERIDFPHKSMHEFLEGSSEKSDLILSLYSQLEKNAIIGSTFGEYDHGMEANRELTALRINQLVRFLETEPVDVFFRRLNLVTVFDPSLGIRISVNLGLFINCIKGNGTDSQVNYWCNEMESAKIKNLYGCFGMTELAHGSNVAGLETTATFDKKTDEFIINTPHIGATKWWIGGAAHSATHTVCYARLVIDSKDYGVKTFIVPLRDVNHKVLPGISIGDIGAKMGREGVDNGWIQFSSVRIPRYFMLQKWCKVSRDGKVTLPPLEQLSYISLLSGRVYMATDSYRICARFITIALRYAVGRKQFKINSKNDSETQLLDYPLHQKRLLPFLALTYAMALGTDKLETQNGQCAEHLESAVKQNDSNKISTSLGEMKCLFNDSGSLKSTLTWLAANCIDECRQACGGHGYSAYNGFGKAYDDWVVQCTWEGDNNVLGMSCGKTIINNVQQVISKNAKISGTMAFLGKSLDLSQVNFPILKTEKDLTMEQVLQALEVLIVKLATVAIGMLKDNDNNWDLVSAQRVELSKLRCHHYLLEAFINKLDHCELGLKQFLLPVINTYALTSILQPFSSNFLQHNLMDKKLTSTISMKLVPYQFSQLRKLAIPLTDSFLQPDSFLHSAIGKYNGDIYDNYFSIVKAENPVENTKAPYSSILEDMLNRKPLSERQRFEKSEEVKSILSK